MAYRMKQQDDSRKVSLKKRERLQEKFVEATATKDEPIIAEALTAELEQTRKQFKEMKKKYESTNKKLEKMTAEKDRHRREADKQKNTVREIRLVSSEKDKKLEELNKELKSVTQSNTELAKLAELYKLQIEELSGTNQRQQNQRLLEENKRLLGSNQQYRQKNLELIRQINSYKQEIVTLKVFDNRDERMKLLNTTLDNTVNELNAYKAKLEEQEERHKAELQQVLNWDTLALIKALQEGLNPDTVDAYEPMLDLVEKVKAMKEAKRLASVGKIDELIKVQEDIRFGYMMKKGNKFQFVSYDGDVFPVIGTADYVKQRPKPEQPARAKVYDGGCVIDELYEVAMEEHARLSKRREEGEATLKKKEKYQVWMAGHKVLIVGSRNQSKYTQTLEEYGLAVMWYNPYEESEQRLKEKFESADIVIICTSHTSHSAMETIDKRDPKVELIERDNADTIFYRTRFALIKRGLLKTGA